MLADCADDQNCAGVLLEGSLARRGAYFDSDIDLRILPADGIQRPFHSEIIDGVRLEIRYADFEHVRLRLAKNPLDVYGYLDGRIPRDSAGRLAELVHIAREIYNSYHVSLEEKRRLVYWLSTAREKFVMPSGRVTLEKPRRQTDASGWRGTSASA